LYRLLFHSNVEQQLKNIPRSYSERIAQAIRALGEDQRPPQSKQLARDIYRLRVGEYRVVYVIFDLEQVVFIGKVARRSEKAYRDASTLLSKARKLLEDESD